MTQTPSPAARVQQLREQINDHNHRYYVLDEPAIPDAEYDRLFNELRALEAANPDLILPDSPTQRVGGAPSTAFSTVDHDVPMLSLGNAFKESDMLDFDRSVRRGLDMPEGDLLGDGAEVEYCCEPKLDGLAVSLLYEDGYLVRGEPGVMAARVKTSPPMCAPSAIFRCACAVRAGRGFSRCVARYI